MLKEPSVSIGADDCVRSMQSPDESGSSGETEGAGIQVAGCPASRAMRTAISPTEMVPERLQRFYPGPAGECEHCKSEALPVERLQWLVLAEGRDLVRRGERELVPGHGALPLFD